MRFYPIYSLCLTLLLSIPAGLQAQDLERSVVKISITKQEYDYNQPWQKSKQSKASGSGCIIDGNRILTCAHVVEYGEFIEVRKAKDNKNTQPRYPFSPRSTTWLYCRWRIRAFSKIQAAAYRRAAQCSR